MLAGLFALGAVNVAAAQVNDPFNLHKSDIGEANPVQFLLQRGKPLALTDLQKDSLKAIDKGLEEAEKPVWKEISALFRQEKALAGRGGGPVTIQVERMSSAGSGNVPNGGRPVRTLPPTARQVQVGLDSTRSVFRQRAWSQLNDSQRHIADSLYTIRISELDREAKTNWK